MRGIILAGGNGTRLYQNTKVVNKHLCRVGDRPMLEYPLATLLASGIQDILVVTGKEHGNTIFSYLGSGHEYGCNFKFAIQDKAGGIAEALALAEDYVNGDNCMVILGDNIFLEDDFSIDVKSFNGGSMLFVKSVEDPSRFGIATVIDGKIVKIVEKPKEPETNLAVAGLYIYDNTVFDKIRKIEYSARGEKEITDVNNLYIKDGKCGYIKIEGFWSDAGTIESLRRCDEYIWNTK
jgi:glucose-1-phosphate thymidylyltransferase